MSTEASAPIIGEDLIRLMDLVEGADSVELKLTVPAASHRTTIATLGLDPLEAQIRQVFFFDTPELALNAAGVVARVRRIQGRDADSVVKLRPVVPAELDASVRGSDGFSVEVDVMPGGFVCSASLKGAVLADAVLPSISGSRAVSTMFTADQRGFFTTHAPADLTLDNLAVLGPIFVLKLRLPKATFTRKVVAEMWLYPDGSRILELSTKCLPAEAIRVAVDVRRALEEKGISTTGQQQTKTKTALEFFAAELMAES